MHRLYRHDAKKRPSPTIDRLMAVVAVAYPFTAAPQIYDIYANRDMAGVSVWTWVGFMAFGMVFLSYGIVHRIKPFIVTQVLWLCADVLIVAGVLLYR